MSIQSMSGVLDQIQFQARQVSSVSSTDGLAAKNKSEKGVAFSDLLLNSVNSINQMQNTAKTQAQDYMTGGSGVSLNDVMVSMQKSSLALNFGVQARNKMVSAYQEIMSMSV